MNAESSGDNSASCSVLESDTPESLAQRIHLLEHAHYPAIIEEITKPAK
jgi:phosphoribosylglycinamide formyltransferase-1